MYKIHTKNELIGLLGLASEQELNLLLANKLKFFREKLIQTYDWFESPKKPRKGLVPTRKMWLVHKQIARTIGKDLLSQLPKNMMGGRPGYTTKRMAALHCNQECVVRLDIQNCFDSINPNMVRKMFRKLLNHRASKETVQLLTELLTIQGKLPQGAHTSPAICNCVLLPTFNATQAYCKTHSLTLSSWIDDFIISGATHDVYAAIPRIKHLMKRHGFTINEKKITISKPGHRFEVTGLTLGKRPSIDKKRREALRRQVVRAVRVGSDTILSHLKGKIEYVRRYNPGFAKRLDTLLSAVPKNQKGGTIL